MQSELERSDRTRYPVSKFSEAHYQILYWLVENPGRPLSECAVAFNYTTAWLGQLIHSDMFQARLADFRKHREVQILSVQEKLMALASQSIDRLAEKTEVEQDSSALSEILRTALRGLGYGAKPSVHVGDNIVHISATAEQLTEARVIAQNAKALTPPMEAEDDSERGVAGEVSDQRNVIDVRPERVEEAPRFGPASAG